MLLFADRAPHAVGAVVPESLRGVFEETFLVTRRARGHRRRQVDKPARIDGVAVHDLECGRRVLRPHGDVGDVAGIDDALALHVLDVEQETVAACPGRLLRRPNGLVVGPRRRRRHQLAFGIAQCREPAAEDAAGVDADRAVDPLRGRYRRVAVDDGGFPPVLACPVVPHRETELVGLASRLAEQRELPYGPGRPVQEVFLHARVRHGELAVVEHVMTHQTVDERRDAFVEGSGLLLQLREGRIETVREPNVPTAQFAQQLDLVVAGHAQGDAALHRVHGQTETVDHPRAAIDEIAQEDQPPTLGMRQYEALAVAVDGVTELAEERAKFVKAAVHVADDVERPGVVAPVGPQFLPYYFDVVDFVLGLQPEPVAESLAPETLDRPSQQACLVADHVRPEIAVATRSVALLADPLRQLKNDRDSECVVLACEAHEGRAVFGTYIGRVDHGQASACETLAGDELDELEGVLRGCLAVGVVADEAAAGVGRDHLGGREVVDVVLAVRRREDQRSR